LEKVLQEYKIDIIALKEIQWIGQGVLEKRNCNVYFCGQTSKHEYECGRTVNSKLRHSVIDFELIDHRFYTLRVKGRFNSLSLVCAHAPTKEKN
jgi:hypothetical protein